MERSAIIWVESYFVIMNEDYICTSCGYRGKPKKWTKGSFAIEIVLWFFFLIPGLIYTIWRLCNKVEVCPSCRQPTMIPSHSPMGQKLMHEFKHNEPKNNDYSDNGVEETTFRPSVFESIGLQLAPDNQWNVLKKWWFWVILILISFFIIKMSFSPTTQQNTTAVPTPPAITEEYKSSLAKTFCDERSKPNVRAVNFADFIMMYEKVGEEVTLKSANGIYPTKENCKKVADLCLRLWKKEECEDIAKEKIWIGMDKDQLILSWGIPNDTNNSVYSFGVRSQWVYADFGPYVYLEGKIQNDMKVKSWQD